MTPALFNSICFAVIAVSQACLAIHFVF